MLQERHTSFAKTSFPIPDVTIIESLKTFGRQDSPSRGDSAVFMLCTSGTIEAEVNHKPYKAGQGDAFLCAPYADFEIRKLGEDFDAKILAISVNAIRPASIRSGRELYDLVLFMRENPIVRLDETELQLMLHYHGILGLKDGTQSSGYSVAARNTLFQAFAYDFVDIIQRRMENIPPSSLAAGRFDVLFRQFLELLVEEKGHIGTVATYAESLHVSPKHLSVVTRSVCGQTALQLIHSATVSAIEDALRNTDESMKEISARMGFPSPSFFVRFCRKHLGVTPRAYRKNYCAEIGKLA